MKTSIIWLFLMAVCLPVTAAATDPSSATGSLYLEVGVVNDFAAQSWQGYNYGGGGQAALGYILGPDVSIQLNVNDLYFPNGATSLTDNEIRIYPELKIYFSALNDIRPYLLAGTGLDLEFIGNTSATNWIAESGLGTEWVIKSNLALFVEVKVNWLRSNIDTATIDQDVPLVWGLRFAL